MNDLEAFFRELKHQYAKERREFIAYNLAKNVMHGPLPSPLHSRMIFDKGEWSRRYVEFLER